MAGNGLRRIIQINGFVKNKETVLNLDGHSFINGTNGAGKTSTLNLIPFFYGATPQQIGITEAGKGSFVGFYLHSQQSLLIYEYDRGDAICCAVAYQSKSDPRKINFRFLRSEYSPEHFYDTTKSTRTPFEGYRLKNHWDSLGLEHSHQIQNIDEYRSIILNDLSTGAGRSVAPQTRRMASVFSLSGGGGKMRHIDKVACTIGTRRGLIDKMKVLIAEIMSDDGITLPTISHHVKDEGIREDVRVLREIERLKGSVDQINSLHTTYLDQTNRCRSALGKLKFMQGGIDSTIESETLKLEEYETELSALTDQYNLDNTELATRLGESQGRFNEASGNKEKLELANEEYIEQELPSKSAQLDGLHNLMDQRKLLKGRLSDLTEGVAELDLWKSKQEASELKRYEKSRSAVQLSFDEAKADMERKTQELEDQKTVRRQKHSDDLEQTREQQREELHQFDRKLITLQAAIDASAYTDEEQARLQQAITELEEAYRLSGIAQADFQDAEREYNRQKTQHDENLRVRAQLATQVDDARQQAEDARRVAYPETNTLLHSLKSSGVDVSNVLKTINPELLHKTGLDPKHHPEGDFVDYYGWSLNLDHLLLPRCAEDQDELVKAFETLDGVSSRMQSRYDEHEDLCTVSAKDLETKRKEMDTQQSRAKNAELSTKLKRDARELIKTENDEAKREREKSFNDELNELKRSEKKLKERHENTIHQIIEGFESAERDRIGVDASILEPLEHAVSTLQEQLTTIAKDHKAALKQIEVDYKKLCSDKGISEKDLDELAGSIKSLSKAIDLIDSFRPVVNEYRHWKSNVWVTYEQIEASVRSLETEIKSAKSAIANLSDSYKESKLIIDRNVMAVKGELHSLERTKKDIEYTLREYHYVSGEVAPVESETPVKTLLREAEEWGDVLKSTRSDLIAQSRRFDNQINRFAGSEVHQQWENQTESLLQRFDIEEGTEEHWLNLYRLMTDFLKSTEDKREAILLKVRMTGQQIGDLYEKLSDAHSKISREANKVNRVIVDNMVFDALSEIEVAMKSKVDSLDYYSLLKRFNQQLVEWQQYSPDQLPDENFIDELDSLLRALVRYKSRSVTLTDYFDIEITINENDHRKVLRTDQQLITATSNGLAYIVLFVIFASITRLLCPDTNIRIHWPIDEFSALHTDNIDKLFKMLDENGITMLTASPTEDLTLLRMFKYLQELSFKEGGRVISIPESKLQQLLNSKGGSQS